MGESFKKLKNRTLLAAALKSATVGLSSGLFIVGTLLIIFTLCSVNFQWALYIPIGLGSAAISGGLCFFFMHPTDRKVAQKYDAEYGFNEKLQTMVEFGDRGEQGDIITLQREDALEKLSNAPAPKVRLSRIWQYILIAVMSAAIAGVGIGLAVARNHSTDETLPPPRQDDDTDDTQDDPVPDGDAFEYTLVMQGNMSDLISSVREAGLDDDISTYMVNRLEELDKKLIDVKLKSVMLEEVYAAVIDIDGLIRDTNSFLTLSSEIAESDANLADAITKGFISYKGRLMDNMPERYVFNLRTGIGDYIEGAMEALVTLSAKNIEVTQLPLDGSKDLGTVLSEYTASLGGAITLSVIEDTDELYNCLQTLCNSLKTIKSQASGGAYTSDSILWSRIDDVFGIYTKTAVSALSVQNYKCIVETFIRQRLSSILDVSLSGLADLYAELEYTPDEGKGDNGEGDDGPGGSVGGGAGSGDVIYGSDDLIYYPVTDEYVKFGEALSNGYETEILNATLAEGFPEELAKYIEAYLNYLHNGTDSKD